MIANARCCLVAFSSGTFTPVLSKYSTASDGKSSLPRYATTSCLFGQINHSCSAQASYNKSSRSANIHAIRLPSTQAACLHITFFCGNSRSTCSSLIVESMFSMLITCAFQCLPSVCCFCLRHPRLLRVASNLRASLCLSANYFSSDHFGTMRQLRCISNKQRPSCSPLVLGRVVLWHLAQICAAMHSVVHNA